MPRRKRDSSRTLLSHHKEKPVQRNAANARERARMRVLSRAFCRLKTTLPWVPADTKLSKLDTLRLASSYISHLKGILKDEGGGGGDDTDDTSIHPAITLTWPFGFNRNGVSGSGGRDGCGSETEESLSDADGSWDEGGRGMSGGGCVHLDHPHPHPSFHHHDNHTSASASLHSQLNPTYHSLIPFT